MKGISGSWHVCVSRNYASYIGVWEFGDRIYPSTNKNRLIKHASNGNSTSAVSKLGNIFRYHSLRFLKCEWSAACIDSIDLHEEGKVLWYENRNMLRFTTAQIKRWRRIIQSAHGCELWLQFTRSLACSRVCGRWVAIDMAIYKLLTYSHVVGVALRGCTSDTHICLISGIPVKNLT